jgi:hypothetical protein
VADEVVHPLPPDAPATLPTGIITGSNVHGLDITGSNQVVNGVQGEIQLRRHGGRRQEWLSGARLTGALLLCQFHFYLLPESCHASCLLYELVKETRFAVNLGWTPPSASVNRP